MLTGRFTAAAICVLVSACAGRAGEAMTTSAANPMPAACDSTGVDGRRLWLDVPDTAVARQTTDCVMQRFAMNNFLYLAGDGGDGHPRFMSLAPWYQAIPQDGSTPRWHDGFKPLRTRALRKTAHEGQAGDGFELLDVDHRRVAYDVRVNKVFVDYLISSGSYRYDTLIAMQTAFEKDPSKGGVWLPSGSDKSPGTLSIKTAWRRYTAEKPCPTGIMHCERDATGQSWGLIGLHLVQKTPTLGEMTWATFEHVANAPDCSPGGRAPIASAPTDPTRPGNTLPEWNLFDWKHYRMQGGDGTTCAVPDGAYQYTVAAGSQALQNQTCGAPSSTPLCNVDPRRTLSGGDGTTGFKRINVCRTTPLAQCNGTDGDAAACLNASLNGNFPRALASKWRYYMLVGSEYMAGHAPATGCFRYDDGPVLTTTPPRSRFPSTCANNSATPMRIRAGDLRIANTAMETWMQADTCLVTSPGATPLMGRDCFACHAPATNHPGWPFGMGDMSFVFDRVPMPAGRNPANAPDTTTE